MLRIILGKLFRPFSHGLEALDSQIDKFRRLRDSCRPAAGAAAGAWPVLPHVTPERPCG